MIDFKQNNESISELLKTSREKSNTPLPDNPSFIKYKTSDIIFSKVLIIKLLKI